MSLRLCFKTAAGSMLLCFLLIGRAAVCQQAAAVSAPVAAPGPQRNPQPATEQAATETEPDLRHVPVQSPTRAFTAPSIDLSKDIATLPASEDLGDSLMARGRYLAAMQVFERVTPRSAVIANKLGVSSEHMLMFDKAKLSFEEALRLDPKYAEAVNNLATVYHSRGDLNRAEKLYRKAIQLKPASADSWQNLGALYYSKRKFKKGDESFREALRIDPGILERTTSRGIQPSGAKQNNAEMHYHLACTFAQAGRNSAALEYLRRSIVEGFHDSNRMLHETMLADLRTSPVFLKMVEDMKKN